MSEGTLGQRRVRVDFNPSGDPFVLSLNLAQADNIDVYERYKNAANDPEEKRLWALAQTAAEEAAMWAVKAATYEGGA
jgi:hypothetical protein